MEMKFTEKIGLFYHKQSLTDTTYNFQMTESLDLVFIFQYIKILFHHD